MEKILMGRSVTWLTTLSYLYYVDEVEGFDIFVRDCNGCCDTVHHPPKLTKMMYLRIR